jgi:glycosyltransferase involved in cell wall biosynthesis
VVHATSFAGPFAGGRQGAVHTATIHDVVWRDAPELLTPRGAQFHESRLTLLRNREDIHLMVPSPPLVERLVADGFAPERIHQFSLGVDSAVEALSVDAVRNVLLGHGVMGPFTLFVGTTEPRKNLARLAAAHQAAFKENPELGPLVIVGPSGWGEQHVDQAVSLGVVAPALLRGLYRDASVVTLPSLAEGWGLPAVEALREGTPVLASTAIPSVAESTEVVRVDPLDEAAIAVGLLEALNLPTDEASRRRRTLSVAHLTWAAAARVHLDVWEMLQGK